MPERLLTRVYQAGQEPTLVYLPGIHGDWTLVASFRAALRERVCFAEFCYPRTLTWSLADYAQAVQAALQEHGIRRGWLLGESFGSQIAWELLKLWTAETEGGLPGFEPAGLILAGGFVRHPVMFAVRQARQVWQRLPLWSLRRFLWVYRHYAVFRHRHAPETLAGIDEFLARRNELDRQAFGHRLDLITQSDPRSMAQQTHRPVYCLAGALDPLVPWPAVKRWLRQYCPGYRGGRTIWSADHNVLSTEPRLSAEQTLEWMARHRADAS